MHKRKIVNWYMSMGNMCVIALSDNSNPSVRREQGYFSQYVMDSFLHILET
jgi:hypothetical protein